jgi:2'-5' RNA ligase
MNIANIFEAGDGNSDFKFGSVQVNLVGGICKAVLEIGKSLPDEVIAEEGREAEPHITVRYGLIDEAEVAVDALKGFGEITAKVSGVGVFNSKEHDVLILTVDSEDLHRANRLLGQTCRYKKADFDYKPHITIAYVKKGLGEKIKSALKLDGENWSQPIQFDTAVVTNKNKSRYTAALL